MKNNSIKNNRKQNNPENKSDTEEEPRKFRIKMVYPYNRNEYVSNSWDKPCWINMLYFTYDMSWALNNQ